MIIDRRVVGVGPAVPGDRAPIGFAQPGDDRRQGGYAGAVLPDERHRLSTRDGPRRFRLLIGCSGHAAFVVPRS